MNTFRLYNSNLVRKLLHAVAFVALLFGFSGCRAKQAADISSSPQSPTMTTPATITSPAPSVTLLPTSGEPGIGKSVCWSMDNISHRSLSGSLLYYYMVMDSDRAIPAAGAPAVYNFDSGTQKGLKSFLPRAISPDSKTLTDLANSSWHFVTKDGEVSYPIPDVTQRNGSTYMFLPNGEMLWEGPPLNEKSNLGDGVTRDLYIFLPTTGDLTFYKSVFLPHSRWDPAAKHDRHDAALFSPDLKYVLYPAIYQGDNLSILLDIESQQIVWYGWSGSDKGFGFEVYDSGIPRPLWRPDSSGVILYNDDESGVQNFYNLSVDGEISQLTHLENLFPATGHILSFLSSPAISPDGQYLAFAFGQHTQIFPGWNSWLLILDLETEAILNPCVVLANGVPVPAYPLWSPDSSAIAVIPDAGNRVLAVDLKEKKIFDLFSKTGLDAGSLIGWIDWEIP